MGTLSKVSVQQSDNWPASTLQYRKKGMNKKMSDCITDELRLVTYLNSTVDVACIATNTITVNAKYGWMDFIAAVTKWSLSKRCCLEPSGRTTMRHYHLRVHYTANRIGVCDNGLCYWDFEHAALAAREHNSVIRAQAEKHSNQCTIGRLLAGVAT